MRSFTIGLDPGHGGKNRGARAAGLCEKDWTLRTAMDLAVLLHQAGPWVRLSRAVDKDVSFKHRAEKLKDCDLVISLHFDSDPSRPDRQGLHAYACGQGYQVAREVTKVHRARQGHWTWRAHNVLRRHKPPAILLELGFLTNPEDRALWTDPEKRGEALGDLRDLVLEFALAAKELRCK